jgi:hypothetical protein
VAERTQYCWEFTARVYQAQEVCFKWVLQAGGRKLFPRSLGFYHWSSARTPHVIRLMTRSHYIDFEKLLWR